MRTLLTLACTNGWIGLTGDIATAFLHAAAATADLYMHPPKEFVQKHGRNIYQKSFNNLDFTEAQQNPTFT